MSQSRYINQAQQRILRLTLALAGNEFAGLTPAELARSVGCSASAVTRDLANLREAGLAERMEDTGRWRLGPKLIQVALAFVSCRTRAKVRIDELDNRYDREI